MYSTLNASGRKWLSFEQLIIMQTKIFIEADQASLTTAEILNNSCVCNYVLGQYTTKTNDADFQLEEYELYDYIGLLHFW